MTPNGKSLPVKYFVKRYSLLIIAQTACLALGLWLEQRLIFYSAGPSQADGALLAGTATAWVHSTTAIQILVLVWIAGLQAVVAYLVLMRDQEEASRKHSNAEKVTQQQYNELMRTRDAVIFGLAKLTESRDPETGNHLDRITIYSTRLATAVRRDPRFRDQATPSFVKLIGISSVLHDIGKVGIRDSILLKPGLLEEQERPHMQRHATIGGKCIREIESRLGKSNFLEMAREIAFNHHEYWDGSGYPKGLCAEEIPLAARIVSIVDVYDALSTKRIYREALPHEQCVEIIRAEAGRQFDPALVEIFLTIESEFRDIAQDFSDAAESSGDRPAPAAETADIGEESEMSLDEQLSAIQAAIDGCADDLAAAASSETCRPLAELPDVPVARSQARSQPVPNRQRMRK
jgi:response regulator RpfG family c-di-GMP phosphodiesterase